MIKFYEFSRHLFRTGYPSALIHSHKIEDEEYGASIFIFIQEVPSLQYRVEIHQLRGVIPRKDGRVENVEALVMEEAGNWVKLHLACMEQTALDKAGVAGDPRECVPVERNWSLELLRLRLRGLPSAAISKLANQVRSKELETRLKEVLSHNPIRVQTVNAHNPSE